MKNLGKISMFVFFQNFMSQIREFPEDQGGITCTVNVLKFQTPKKKEHPKFIFPPQAKGSNKFCKIGYFPQRILGIFLFEIKILLYKFLEH